MNELTTGELAIAQSNLPTETPEWPHAAGVALDALSQLVDGVLDIKAQDISLIGRGTPDGIAQAADVLAGLPAGYAVTSDLALWDDGAPFTMTMSWDGTTASAAGKFPAAFIPSGPAGVAVDNAARYSFLADETGDFTTNAAASTIALGLMATGTLQITAQGITLIGTAASPQVGGAMDNALVNAAVGTTTRRDLIYLDDGSPAAWLLAYDAAIGAQIEGRLPVGLGVDDLAQRLGVTGIGGTAGTALEDGTIGTALDSLQIVAAYLPEIETMTYAQDRGRSMLDLVVSPGVDLDLVAVDLADRLPPDLAFALSPLETLPATGTARINAATGLEEAFVNGFWLPDFEFEADVDGCAAQSGAVLERSQIGFLSASARLDATSTRAINAWRRWFCPALMQT